MEEKTVTKKGRTPKQKKIYTPTESKKIYYCSRCGMQTTSPTGLFNKTISADITRANNYYANICTSCVAELFDFYKEKYSSKRTATIIICHILDVPFIQSVFESCVNQDPDFSFGIYNRVLSSNQFKGQTFANTIVNGDATVSDKVFTITDESKWPPEEVRQKNEVIEAVGYDPFDGYSPVDRRFLFNEFAKYLTDDVIDDTFKISQIIQIVNNNNQIRQYDVIISRLNPAKNASQIKDLNELKRILVNSTDKIAKENEISVKNRSNKDAGKSTLTYLMRDLREKGFEDAEENYYGQLMSDGTQWAANMSQKAIMSHALFDENDKQEILNYQRNLINDLQNKVDTLTEEKRCLLVKIKELNTNE